jgi:CHAD domain-containing protein
VAGEDASAGDVVLAYLWKQADAIRATDPRVRQNAPDSVHAMRVACRRMRSTLQSFRVVLERERTDALVDELRWLAAQLAGSRDLQVQEQRIGAAVSALPAEFAMGPIAAQTTRFFARRRADASYTADEAMDSDRYLALLDAIDALLADPPRTPTADTPAGVLLPTVVAKAVKGPTDRCATPTRRRRARSATSICTRCARRPSGCGTPQKRSARCRVARLSGWSGRHVPNGLKPSSTPPGRSCGGVHELSPADVAAIEL